jgi:hypothetical protein
VQPHISLLLLLLLPLLLLLLLPLLLLLQRDNPEKQYRMVVSMSFGAAGPLSIERMYFK